MKQHKTLSLPSTKKEVEKIIHDAGKQERKKLADRLHDYIWPDLAAALLMIATVKEQIKENKKSSNILLEAIKILRESLTKTRDLLFT